MSSILTNNAAITALQSLRMTQQSLAQTQSQISTGLAIGSAADNPATWSIAQTMTSDQGVLSTLSSNLSQSSQSIGVAMQGVNAAITVMNSIKAAVAQAELPGADTAQILTSVKQLGAQLNTIVQSSSFNGANLLNGSQSGTINYTASYTDGQTLSTAGASVVNTIGLPVQTLTTGTAGSGILDGGTIQGSNAATNFTSLTTTDLTTNAAATLSNADAVVSALTSYASTLGATQSRVNSQNSFLQTINSALTSGVGALVDADMNQASTRLQALQTQQQLGVQSISIANQSAQMILKLFQ